MTESEDPGSTSPSEHAYRLRQPIKEGRRTVVISMPKGWARAALSGVEAALLGWVVPALLAILGLLAEGTNPWVRGVEVTEAAAIGTDFWALSLGAPIVIGGLPISLMPLLWTAAQVLILRGLLQGGRAGSAAGLWAAIPTFVLTAVFIIAASPNTTRIPAILLGAFLVSFLAAFWAVLSRSDTYPAWFAAVSWVWSGIRTGAWWFLVAGVLSAGTLLVAALQARPQMAEVSQALGAGGFSGILLALVQVAYLPVLAAWALAWLSGAGFTIAQGDIYAPTTLVESTLPMFPVAEMVPSTATGLQVVWIPIVLGLVTGGFTTWQLRHLSYIDALRRTLVAVLFFSFLIGVWFALSSGALGAERMLALGPTGAAWPLLVAELAGSAALVAVVVHPHALATFSAWWGAAVGAVSGGFAGLRDPKPAGQGEDRTDSSPTERQVDEVVLQVEEPLQAAENDAPADEEEPVIEDPVAGEEQAQ